jgi:DNA polymerase III alpha subunit (gram-positive type)
MTIDDLNLALFFDCEATGLHTQTSELIEVGIVSSKGIHLSERAKPHASLPSHITKLTGITDHDLTSAQSERELILKVHNILKDAPVLGGYFIHLDIEYLRNAYSRNGLNEQFEDIEKKPCICAKTLARLTVLDLAEDFSLAELCQHLEIPAGVAHNATEDAQMALRATEKMTSIIGATSLKMLLDIQGPYVRSPWEHPQMPPDKKRECRQRWNEFVENSSKTD